MALKTRNNYPKPENDELTGILNEEQEDNFNEDKFNEEMNSTFFPENSSTETEYESDDEDIEEMDKSDYSEEKYEEYDDDETYEEASETDETYAEQLDDEELDDDELNNEDDIEDDDALNDENESQMETQSESAGDQKASEEEQEHSVNKSSSSYTHPDLKDLSAFNHIPVFKMTETGSSIEVDQEDALQERIEEGKKYFTDLKENQKTYKGCFDRTVRVHDIDENGNVIEKEAIASVYEKDFMVCIPYDKYATEKFWKEHQVYVEGKIDENLVHQLLSKRLGSYCTCDIEEIGKDGKIIGNKITASDRICKKAFLSQDSPFKPGVGINCRIIQVRDKALLLDCYGIEYILPVEAIFVNFVTNLNMFFKIGEEIICYINDIKIDKKGIHLDLSYLKMHMKEIIEKMESYRPGDTLTIIIGSKSEENQFGASPEGVPCIVPYGNYQILDVGDVCTVRVRKKVFTDRPFLATTLVYRYPNNKKKVHVL